MNTTEYAQIDKLMQRMFKNATRPNNPAEYDLHNRSNYPAWADLDARTVVMALLVLQHRGQVFEPAVGQVREVVVQIKSREQAGEPATPQEAWMRLADAVRVWNERRAAAGNSQPGLRFEETPDGLRPVRDEVTPPWREAAGATVCEWLDANGGPFVASEQMTTAAYRAQFRDFITGRLEARAMADAIADSLGTMDELERQLAGVTPEMAARVSTLPGGAAASLNARQQNELGTGTDH